MEDRKTISKSSQRFTRYMCLYTPTFIFQCTSFVLNMLFTKISIGKNKKWQLLHEALQKQKIKKQQKWKNEMEKQRLTFKEHKSRLPTGI